jgi:uncharacterized glyoxalase superfamily protein PhnB
MGSHRVQINVGYGAVILRELRDNEVGAQLGVGHSVTIRVDDADAHYLRAKQYDALIPAGPVTYPYGERQYSAEDLAGHSWTFSQSVADADPKDWGGVSELL